MIILGKQVIVYDDVAHLNTVGDRIRHIRKLREMTADRLSKKAIVSRTAIGKLERNEIYNSSIVGAIAKGLEVDVLALTKLTEGNVVVFGSWKDSLLGDRVKQARLYNGIGISELSALSGISRQSVNRIEENRAINVTVNTLYKLADALNLDRGLLLVGIKKYKNHFLSQATIYSRKELGDRIGLLRRAKFLTQAELADKAVIGYRTVTRIESGLYERPQLRSLKRICHVLDIDIRKLLKDIHGFERHFMKRREILSKDTLGERIKLLRNAEFMTAKELADKCLIHKQDLYEYEDRNVRPSADILDIISLSLDISTSRLAANIPAVKPR